MTNHKSLATIIPRSPALYGLENVGKLKNEALPKHTGVHPATKKRKRKK